MTTIKKEPGMEKTTEEIKEESEMKKVANDIFFFFSKFE